MLFRANAVQLIFNGDSRLPAVDCYVGTTKKKSTGLSMHYKKERVVQGAEG